MQNTKKRVLIFVGLVCTGLGVLGIFVPVLPTTPFLLLAAACFIRSSPALYRWLMNNRVFGCYLSSYLLGKGMPGRMKALTIALLWITIGLSIAFVVSQLVVKVLLLSVAIGVTIHICLVKRRTR